MSRKRRHARGRMPKRERPNCSVSAFLKSGKLWFSVGTAMLLIVGARTLSWWWSARIDYDIEVVQTLTEIVENELESGPLDLLRFRKTSVYVVDYATERFMTFAMHRMSEFVANPVKHGEILDQSAVSLDKAWAGHDLRAQDIAAFLNKATAEGEELFPEEDSLVDLLGHVGIVRKDEAGIFAAAPHTVVLGLTQGQDKPPGEMWAEGMDRQRVASHELLHGLHLTIPEYAEAVKKVWDRLSNEQRSAFRRLMELCRYDTSNEELMLTEFVAHVHMISSPDYYQGVENKRDLLSRRQSEVLLTLGPDKPIWTEFLSEFRPLR